VLALWSGKERGRAGEGGGKKGGKEGGWSTADTSACTLSLPPLLRRSSILLEREGREKEKILRKKEGKKERARGVVVYHSFLFISSNLFLLPFPQLRAVNEDDEGRKEEKRKTQQQKGEGEEVKEGKEKGYVQLRLNFFPFSTPSLYYLPPPAWYKQKKRKGSKGKRREKGKIAKADFPSHLYHCLLPPPLGGRDQ